MGEESSDASKGLVEGLIEALSDKHSQLDVRLQDLTLSLTGDRRLGVTVSGALSLAVHTRDLTEDEKSAHAAENLSRIQSIAS